MKMPLIKDADKPCLICKSIEFHIKGQVNLIIKDNKLIYQGSTPTGYVLICSSCDTPYRFKLSDMTIKAGNQ